MNYLYNGVELPDINSVWTDKETYPYASLVRMYSADETGSSEAMILYLSNNVGIYQDIGGASFIPSGSTIRTYVFVVGAENWELISDGTNVGGISHTLHNDNSDMYTCVWTNYDVLVERWNGSNYEKTNEVHFAASTPVPVNAQTPALDLQSLFMGWKAGRLIALHRNKLRIIGSQYWLNWAFDTTDLKLTVTDNTPDNTTNSLDTIFSGDTLTIGLANTQPDSGDSGDSGSREDELPITPVDLPDSGDDGEEALKTDDS